MNLKNLHFKHSSGSQSVTTTIDVKKKIYKCSNVNKYQYYHKKKIYFIWNIKLLSKSARVYIISRQAYFQLSSIRVVKEKKNKKKKKKLWKFADYKEQTNIIGPQRKCRKRGGNQKRSAVGYRIKSRRYVCKEARFMAINRSIFRYGRSIGVSFPMLIRLSITGVRAIVAITDIKGENSANY